MDALPFVAFGALAGLWTALGLRVRGVLHTAPRLGVAPPADGTPPASDRLPLVSVLLPARDEANRLLAPCVRSLLAQTYPRLEIVAVDDRSGDATGDILRGLAQESAAKNGPAMTVLSGTDPPPGWVGKQNALMQAAARATGDYLLCVDADALYAPSVIADAVACARAERVDALSLLPRVGVGDWGVSMTYPVGAWAMLLAAPLSRVNDARTRTALAWGGFFLFRRETFEAVGGFADVSGETSEDTKMAALLKRRGYRFHARFATDHLYTPMYPRFSDLWRGTMKNVYAGPVATPLIALAIALLAGIAPLVTLCAVARGSWMVALSAGVWWAAEACALLPVLRMVGAPPWQAPLAPFGALVASAQMLCATWRIAVTGQGVAWRGRSLRARSVATSHHSVPVATPAAAVAPVRDAALPPRRRLRAPLLLRRALGRSPR